MEMYFLLVAKWLLSVLLSIVVLHMLSQPLVALLARLCPDEQAANFWLSYTKVALVLAPLLLVSIIDLVARFDNPMDNLRLAVVAILSGLLACLQTLGRRLGKFIVTPVQPGETS